MTRTALVFTVLLALAVPAEAQRSPDWTACAGRDPDAAIEACTRIIHSGRETQINLSIAYQNRGYSYGRKNDTDKAISDYSEAVRINPRNAQAWTNRGARWQYKKEYQRSIADHTEAIRLDPRHQDAWYNRGNVYQEMGEKEKAIADYRQALRVNPKDADAINNLKQLGVDP